MKIGLMADTVVRNMRKLTTLFALEGLTIGSEWKYSRINCAELEMAKVWDRSASMGHYAPCTSGCVGDCSGGVHEMASKVGSG